MENEMIEQEINAIKSRNRKVEIDKAWETSWTRKICIAILTYFVVVLYSFIVAKFNNIWLSSIVPVIGFILSTLSLRFVRHIWESMKNQKNLNREEINNGQENKNNA